MGKFQSQRRRAREAEKQAHKHEMNISEFLRWLIEKQSKEDENKERK